MRSFALCVGQSHALAAASNYVQSTCASACYNKHSGPVKTSPSRRRFGPTSNNTWFIVAVCVCVCRCTKQCCYGSSICTVGRLRKADRSAEHLVNLQNVLYVVFSNPIVILVCDICAVVVNILEICCHH